MGLRRIGARTPLPVLPLLRLASFAVGAPMNLRPIETMGVDNVLSHLGLAKLPATVLQERMPWPYPDCERLPEPPEGEFLLVDPLAVYVFVRDPAMPAGTLGIRVFVPNGERVKDGFIFQRLLVWIGDDRTLKMCPQEKPVLLIRGRIQGVRDITTVRTSGPAAMSSSLDAEVPHALAGLAHVLRKQVRP